MDLATTTAPALVAPSLLGLALSLLLLLVLTALSGSFSGSEAVLFSLTRVQTQANAGSRNPFRRAAAQLMQRPKRTLMVLLLANTAVNVLLYANTFVLFTNLQDWLGAWAPVLSAVLSILIVTICGEALPKTLGVSLADRLAPYSAALVQTAGYVLGPVSRVIEVVLVDPLTRVLFGPQGHEEAPAHDLTNDELKTLLEMSRRGGVISSTEDSFLREVIDLGYLRVRDVMVPRVEVKAFDLAEPPEGLRALMRETHLKKVPVYEGSIDNVVGLIYAKMFFFNPARPLRELVVPARFVPENITCEQLLSHFRATRTQLAIVVDEYGGMAGLVTLEDVLEAIVGDIREADDHPEPPEIGVLSDDEYEISGRLSAQYWTVTFGLPELPERVATVGGLVTVRLGRPARVGDVVRLANVELRVLNVVRRRVDRLHLRLLHESPEVVA